jgi:hypothetical protein
MSTRGEILADSTIPVPSIVLEKREVIIRIGIIGLIASTYREPYRGNWAWGPLSGANQKDTLATGSELAEASTIAV